jgi:hypothetical protein
MPISDPGVDFFVSFPDLDPNTQKQCIYFVKADRPDRRCKYDHSDSKRAIELHRIITESEPEETLVKHIEEYIKSNCCDRARHRDLVLSSPLLIPLVERWLDEVLNERRFEDASRQSTPSTTPTTPKRISRADGSATSSCNKSAPSATSRATTVETLLSTLSYDHFDRSIPSAVGSIPLQIEASLALSPCPHFSSAIAPSKISSDSESREAQKRYNLRPRAIDNSFIQWARKSKLSLSEEFHPHINEPTSEDTVEWRFRETLKERDHRRDFKTGAVYMYSRTSSPGYVKIGWTSKSVDDRLAEWSECGYTPMELFRMTGVPYAQRVETLTHYELIKEWRREQLCKGCLKKKQQSIRHQEWFNVSQERAIRVLQTWAKLFKKASPYERSGSLKSEWRNILDIMKAGGEAITSETLLKHYEATVSKR